MLQISVVIPTYNRIERLLKVLEAFSHQTFDASGFEIIVVSDGCLDGTSRIIKHLRTPYRLKALEQQNQGPAAARNNGIMHSAGEYVLFIDDDVIPTSNLIHEHVLTHNEHGSDIVALGPMCTPEDFAMSAWVRWEQAMLLKQYNSMQSGHWKPTARQFYTGNTSLRRSHLLASGGFDHTFRRAEDVELAYRLKNAGLKFIFNPKAIGYHYAERSFNSWMETPYAYGRNDVIFTRDKDQSWLLPTVFEEFHNRNILIQKLVRVCLDRHKVSEYAVSLLRFFSRHSDYLGLERIVQMAHSGLFNLQYYQGISDELGGRISFFEQVQR